MSVWRAASKGEIAPDAIIGPPPEEGSGWAESAVDQYSRLTRATANQVRASFSLAALQAHRSLASLYLAEPVDEEFPDLQAARSVLFLIHRAVDRSILRPVWDCPPRYRRFFEARPARFRLDGADVQGRELKWDHFGGLDKYLDLLDYCAYLASEVAGPAVEASLASPEQSTAFDDEPDPPAARPDYVAREVRRPRARHPVSDSDDSVRSFVDGRCEAGPDSRSLAGELYAGYLDWCEETGRSPLPQRSFGMRLTELGLERRRRGRGKHWWEGIRLSEGPVKAMASSANFHQG